MPLFTLVLTILERDNIIIVPDLHHNIIKEIIWYWDIWEKGRSHKYSNWYLSYESSKYITFSPSPCVGLSYSELTMTHLSLELISQSFSTENQLSVKTRKVLPHGLFEENEQGVFFYFFHMCRYFTLKLINELYKPDICI